LTRIIIKTILTEEWWICLSNWWSHYTSALTWNLSKILHAIELICKGVSTLPDASIIRC
jgi:hypothetical protein